MKLKKVAALCNSVNIYRLHDKVDSTGEIAQWLGDGCATYPLHGLPYMEEDSLYRMFDVTEKKQDKAYFIHEAMPEGINVDDVSATDQIAEDMGVTISYGGTVLLPLRYTGGILFIQSKYLGPLEDQADFLQLYVRRTESGGRYVVAKTGMLIAGIIYPYKAVQESFVQQLEEVAAMTRRELERCRSVTPVETEPEEGDQTSVLDSMEGGDGEA